MKLLPALLCALIFLAVPTVLLAAAPTTNAPPAKPDPTQKPTEAKSPAPPAPVPPQPTSPVPAASGFKLDDYIQDLTKELKLSDSEKQEIQNDYLDDGAQLKSILNDDALSPLQQAQQVAALRDARNAKIETLLFDLDRQHEFLQIEPKYRVALTLLAANGGLVAAAPPAAK